MPFVTSQRGSNPGRLIKKRKKKRDYFIVLSTCAVIWEPRVGRWKKPKTWKWKGGRTRSAKRKKQDGKKNPLPDTETHSFSKKLNKKNQPSVHLAIHHPSDSIFLNSREPPRLLLLLLSWREMRVGITDLDAGSCRADRGWHVAHIPAPWHARSRQHRQQKRLFLETASEDVYTHENVWPPPLPRVCELAHDQRVLLCAC